MIFENRKEAGIQLANQLQRYRIFHPIVVALPRGGVPVGLEIAKKLNTSLEILIVQKISSPENPEYGIGAVAERSVGILDMTAIQLLQISPNDLKRMTKKAKEELHRKITFYRKTIPFPHVKNKTVILVDDGLATGVSAQAAIASLKKNKGKQIIFAAPICAIDTAREIRQETDKTVCLSTPADFTSVGSGYHHFGQVTDSIVISLLQQNRGRLNRYHAKAF